MTITMVLVYDQAVKVCGWCEKKLLKRQRVYCSRSCQSTGLSRRNTTATVVVRNCDFCNGEYGYHPSWKKDKNTRYCSRGCKDAHQQTTYRGDGNPMYGTTWTDEQRVAHVASLRAYWDKPENREQLRVTMQRVAERLGHWPGQDVDTWMCRKQTYVSVYGVTHPWMKPEIRQKCEDTTFRLYGKHTWDLGHEGMKSRDTSIELIVSSSLAVIGVEFVHPYVMMSGSVRKEYDFYVPTLNTLIEADGDYWHGNPQKYANDKLDKIQQHTRTNDVSKDVLARDASMRLLRFWETDVKRDGFTVMLLEALWAGS